MSLQVLRRVGLVLLFAGLLGGSICADSGAAIRPASLPADTTDDPQVQKHLIRGTTEVQLGDYKEAIVYFETALDKAPTSPTLLQALADAYEAQGDITTALFYARKARTHGTGRSYFYHRLAELQRQAGQLHAAGQTYQDVLTRFPDDKEAYRALASLQAEQGRPQAALDTYNTLLNRSDRLSVATHREILKLYRRTGNVQGIEKTLRILVDRRPNVRKYRRLLGEHYAEQERLESALDLLVPLAQQQPSDTTLQEQVQRLSRKTDRSALPSSPADRAGSRVPEDVSVGQLVQRARSTYDQALSASPPPDTARLREAEVLVQSALNRNPGHVSALDLRARIFRQKGEYEKAGRVLERALEENPRDAVRWARTASAYLRAHQYEKAVSISEEGLLLFPGHAPLARTAGLARLRSGNPKRALNHFQAALDLLDDSASPQETAPLHAALGLAYTSLDRPKEAAEAFKTAQSLAPDHPTVLRRSAYSLAVQGKHLDRALKLARRAVKHSPSDPRCLDTLGWVYFRRKNLAAARRHLQRALDAGPPSARILEHFGDVQRALGNDAAAREYWQKALDRASDQRSLRRKLDNLSPS